MRYVGIRGFDSILRGGIPARTQVLLIVPSGLHRQLLAAHWIVEGLRAGDRVLVVVSGEAPDDLLARLGRMGVDAAGALQSHALTIVDWNTCWSRPVEGVVEEGGILRASKAVADLGAAVERGAQAILPGRNRRALVDFLPLAATALDEQQTTAAVDAMRKALSGVEATSIFVADPSLSETGIDALLPTFHAVLDARVEGEETLGIAVLGVGSLKLTPRYHRVRIREDEAAVEVDTTVRTFSCPICDARVRFDAQVCPSCGTLRADMASRARPSTLMDYVESLGRTDASEPPSGRVSTGPSEGRPGTPVGSRVPAGRVNGTAPGRVNGVAPGRVNGIAPPMGRTNGLQSVAGRTNGVTNGLTNGLRRVRSGFTNGLTNGSGFTNGLGSRRYLREARRARWKMYLVPMVAASLLLSPFLSAVPASLFAVDGDPDEWGRIPGFEQTASPGLDTSVSITGYKVAFQPEGFFLYVTVQGHWFDDEDEVEALYAFLDQDRDATTGYAVHGLGAEALLTVEGSGQSVHAATLRLFAGTDAHNWSAWGSARAATAAVRESVLEAYASSILDLEGSSILVLADNGRGSRSYSEVAFGRETAALRVGVRSRADVVARGAPEVLAVELVAHGADDQGDMWINVTDLDIQLDGPQGVRVIEPTLPVSIQLPARTRSASRTISVSMNTTDAPVRSLLTARLTRIVTESPIPVLILGDSARVYVEEPPPGKIVDGLFGDWAPEELSQDRKPPRADEDRDIHQFAAARVGNDLHLYVDVRGQVFAGMAVPVRRVKSDPGGEPRPSAPAFTPRVAGEDVLRAYVDADRNSPGGVPIHGLHGADLLLEVRGTQGRVTGRLAFEWRDGWHPMSSPLAEHDARRFEASLPLSDAGAVEVVFESRGWEGMEETTDVSGTRGVRSDRPGTYRADGRFTAAFDASGLIVVSGEGAGLRWTLPTPEAGSWDLAPTAVGVRYQAAGAEVRYSVSDFLLKEEVVFHSPPSRSVLEFGFSLAEGTTIWQDDDQPLRIFAGPRPVFELPQPYALDAAGIHTDLEFELDLAGGLIRIPLPAALLAEAAYPLIIDPVVRYTLENEGPSTDTGENMGWSVAVGDFNGDSYADVLTGAPTNDRPPRDTPNGLHGFAYIFFGPFSADDDTPDVWINSTMTNSTRFGYSVAAGKFNGDQYWDALVSRRSFLPGFFVGNVSIYYGSASWSGEESTPDVDFVPPSTPKNFGEVVVAGDLDNSGQDDVLIAEPGRDLNADSTAEGVVYVYKSPFGAAETTSDYRLVPSSNSGGQLSLAIAVGIVDDDAFVDVVVGEPRFSGGAGDGRVQFYKGSHFTSGSGDVTPDATIGAPSGGGTTGNFGASLAVGPLDGDPYADLLVGAPFKFTNDGRAYAFLANSDGTGLTTGASPLLTLISQSTAERFGTSVLIADWAGDGGGDAIVGASQAGAGGTNRGSVYWFDDPLSDQTVDETVSGTQDGEFFGRVLAAGKFSSDGTVVLAIGGYLWDENAANPNDNDGRVVVATVPESLAVVIPILIALAGISMRGARATRHRSGQGARSRR